MPDGSEAVLQTVRIPVEAAPGLTDIIAALNEFGRIHVALARWPDRSAVDAILDAARLSLLARMSRRFPDIAWDQTEKRFGREELQAVVAALKPNEPDLPDILSDFH